MTLLQSRSRLSETGLLNAEDFVQRLIGRSQLERDDDFEHGELGLRDPLTGVRVRVRLAELNRYAAGEKERESLLRENA